MQNEESSGSVTAALPVTDAPIPDTASDEKNADSPESGADDKKPDDVAETPEQQEEKRESRRQRAERRRAAELAEAKAEARIYKQLHEANVAKAESKAPVAPKREDFASEDEYQDARVDFRADQKFAEREAARRDQPGSHAAQQQPAVDPELKASWDKREKVARELHRDYREVVADFVEHDFKHFSGEAADLVMESDAGPQLLYYLGTHEEEADSIRKMSPARQAIALSKLEDKLGAAPARKTSNAPAPANVTTGGKAITKDPAKMTQTEYEDYRKSQGAKWAR